MKKQEKSISKIRIAKQKAEFIAQLQKIPIIQVVCEKLSIGRATFYRWKTDDKAFSKKVDESFLHGKLLVNDLAESQLISAIKDKSIQAVTYWLRHHHVDYSNVLTLKHEVDTEELTPEQAKIVKQALKLASLTKSKKSK